MSNTTDRHSHAAHFRREARTYIQNVVMRANGGLLELRKLTDKLCRKADAENDDASVREILAYQRVVEIFANGVVLPAANAATEALNGKEAKA